MNLFEVRDQNTNVVVASGFNNKMEAKAKRAELHLKEGINEKDYPTDKGVTLDKVQRFKITCGPDHDKKKVLDVKRKGF